jgi:phenylacetate-coenzyme A ligase PaaK-like adenylate-forming protein
MGRGNILKIEEILNAAKFARENSAYYNNLFGVQPITNLTDFQKLPLSDSSMLLHKKEDLLTNLEHRHYAFTTGGSTGNPKTVYLSYEELHNNIMKHGKSYKRAGIDERDRVATFGLPGVLTSEFTVYLALEQTGAFILPIGENDDYLKIYYLVKQYNINTLLLMPTDLITFINFLQSNDLNLNIEKIITGGEALSSVMRDFVRNNLNTKIFGATYQSMDFGTVGCQNHLLAHNEYQVNNNDLFLEIVDHQGDFNVIGKGELIITNTFRKLLPVIRYKTGDLVDLRIAKDGRQYITIYNRISNVPKIAGEKFETDVIKAYLGTNNIFTGRYQYILSNKDKKDLITIKLETTTSTINKEEEIEKLLSFLYTEFPKIKVQSTLNQIHPISIIFGFEDELGFIYSSSAGKLINLLDERG